MITYKTEDEAIEAAKKAVVDSDDYVEFAGQNCDDDNNCPGWDGESSRCVCGNRRVYWSAYKDDKGEFYAVALAD